MTNSQTIKQDGNKFYNLVKEFHVAFNHPVADKPTPLTLERATDRTTWTGEEVIAEFLQQSANNEEEYLQAHANLLTGLEKAKQKSLAMDYNKNDEDKIVGQVDALIDGLYFIFGSLVEIGIEPDKVFKIVHSANMSKLFTAENGTKYAKYREEDGKILKSPEFFAPEDKLKEEVLRQIKAAESK